MLNVDCMFGVIAFGSKQFKIKPGISYNFDNLEGNVGDLIELHNLLMLSDNDEVIFDRAALDKYVVKGVILSKYRGDKVVVLKKHRRKDYTLKRGHRQYQTVVKIESIELHG